MLNDFEEGRAKPLEFQSLLTKNVSCFSHVTVGSEPGMAASLAIHVEL